MRRICGRRTRSSRAPAAASAPAARSRAASSSRLIGWMNADSLISTRSPLSETPRVAELGLVRDERVCAVRPGQDPQHRHQVLAAAGQRAEAEQPLRLAVRDRVGARVRHEPVRGLVPEHAAEEGRDADRAGDVRAEPERRRPAADRRALAAGGAAGRPRGVIRGCWSVRTRGSRTRSTASARRRW